MASAPRRRWLKRHALPSDGELSSPRSITSGRWTKATNVAIAKAQTARIRYGVLTDRASCAVVAPAAMKMKTAPSLGAMVVADELKKPARLMRDAAVSGRPSAPK